MFENFNAELKKRLDRIDHNVDAMFKADTTLPFDAPEEPSVTRDTQGITRINVIDTGWEYQLVDGKWQAKAPF